MNRTTERQAMFAALLAISASGGKLHWPKAPDLSGYSAPIRDALIRDWKKATETGAYAVERPFWGNGRHGWRLVQFTNRNGGQSDVGPMFTTAGAFLDAMRLAEALTGGRR